jgi:hypothetical protein
MKVSMVRRWKIRITLSIYRDGKLIFPQGAIVAGCYLIKPCDGLYVDVDGITYNIPLDCFDIIKGE